MHPALRLERLSTLPVSVRIFATAAANGCEQAMAKVVGRIVLQPELSSRFLPVVYANLDPARIPSTEVLDTGAPDADILSPLSIGLRCLEALTLTRSVPTSVYAEVWPRLWIWIQVIEIYRSLLPPQCPVETFIRACLISILEIEDVAHIIPNTPGTHILAGRIWAGLDPSMERLALNVGMESLFRFMRISQWTQSNLEDFIEGCGGIAPIAELTVQHIHSAAHAGNPLQPSAVQALDGLLTFVRHAVTSKLSLPLCDAGIVPALVKALIPLNRTPQEAVDDVLDACLESLAVLICAPGYRFLTAALDTGLLDTLLALEPYGSRKIGLHIDRFIRDILPGSLAFLPVVRAFRDRAPNVDSVRASQHLEWLPLLELATERIRLLGDFESPKYVRSQGCDGPQCGLIIPVAETKRCSGCRTHFYCSVECQTADWCEGSHRAFCLKRQSLHCRKPDASGIFGKRNDAFMRFLILRDYQTKKFDILMQQLAFVHSTKSTEFATIFRYLEGRCTTGIVRLEDVSPFSGLTERDFKTGMVHHIFLPGGRCDCPSPTVSRDHRHTIDRVLHMRADSSAVIDGVVRIAGMLPEGTDVKRLNETWPELFEELRMLSELDIKETHG
ncbi:hypothetical protein C8R47DRAFT_1203218 [Mycena vitilis]|nr:hypothetical protein C8R47DRAFT_1203218 [Mycena vitilis]